MRSGDIRGTMEPVLRDYCPEQGEIDHRIGYIYVGVCTVVDKQI